MSRRRRKGHDEVNSHSFVIYCDRGHPRRVIARHFIGGDAASRAFTLGTDGELTNGTPTYQMPRLLMTDPGWSETPRDDNEEVPYKRGDGAQRVKIRWHCRSCGENVSLNPRDADRLVDEYLTRGEQELDLAALAAIVGRK